MLTTRDGEPGMKESIEYPSDGSLIGTNRDGATDEATKSRHGEGHTITRMGTSEDRRLGGEGRILEMVAWTEA